MAIDLDAVRSAYRGETLGPDFNCVPSREERIAESERVFVRLCENSDQDPEAEGLGYHGALIGGHGKPTRVIVGNSRPFENYCRPRLAPEAWFRHRGDVQPHGQKDVAHKHLSLAIASHLAGTPNESRPTPAELREAFLAEKPTEMERFWLYSILCCASVHELRKIIFFEGMPLHVVVRAIHSVGVLRHDLTNWLNQFANRPSARNTS